jgi:hypothetical protein
VTSAPRSLVVLAEVVAPAEAVPPPGIVHALQVDRYRVMRVISGTYRRRVLFAAREPGSPFAKGERLKLRLSSELPEGTSPLITEPAEVASFGLFYCTRFEKSA